MPVVIKNMAFASCRYMVLQIDTVVLESSASWTLHPEDGNRKLLRNLVLFRLHGVAT
jgi:hypothetical protein